MEKQMALLWEVSFTEFLIVTLVIGGALAYAVGRSTARNWSGWGLMTFYCLLLMAAIRFLHFSLFNGTFFLPPETSGTALHYGLIDFAVIFAMATIGRTVTRAEQMTRQYRFERSNTVQVR